MQLPVRREAEKQLRAGEVVVPQTGNFDGGWITSDVVGPFKGGGRGRRDGEGAGTQAGRYLTISVKGLPRLSCCRGRIPEKKAVDRGAA